MTERIYTPDELRKMIAGMTDASAAFYAAAQQIGNHAFIEFTGLMNEYIQLCKAAVDKDQDFTCANTHIGQELPFAEHNLEYLLEKLDCIYGPSIAGRLKQRLTNKVRTNLKDCRREARNEALEEAAWAIRICGSLDDNGYVVEKNKALAAISALAERRTAET